MGLGSLFVDSIKMYFFDDKAIENLNKKSNLVENFMLITLFSLIFVVSYSLFISILPAGIGFIFLLLVPMLLVSMMIYLSGWNLMHWILFKLFGGKGSLEKHMHYGFSLNYVQIILVVISIFLTFLIYFSNYIIYLIFGLWIIYYVWRVVLGVKIFSKLHKVSNLKACLIIVLPIFIIGITYLLFVSYYMVMIATMMGSTMPVY